METATVTMGTVAATETVLAMATAGAESGVLVQAAMVVLKVKCAC
jgi:hypothetical protein